MMNDPLNNQDPLYNGDNIRTFSDRYVNVFEPDPDTLSIEDIAHGLSYQPRFAGQSKIFISVAQHSINVAQHFTEPDLKLAALMHDSSEAYLCDIPSPIKRKLIGYKDLERQLMMCLAKKFRFNYPINEQIKEADKIELQWEFKQAMLSTGMNSWTPLKAKEEFLSCYYSIVGKEVSDG